MEHQEHYKPEEIEPKWRRKWAEWRFDRWDPDSPKPKYYCLDMFPYPSGSGLHVGHWRGYVLSDVWTRVKTMQGYNVLHPMGWDAFGLPAENDAIKKKVHPEEVTRRNISNMKRQLREIGCSYHWDRELNTSSSEYYRWTQWIFLQMYRRGLAYRTEMPINWCPSCKVGLANEEAVGGVCERCGSTVTKKNLTQWMLRITRYADRLLDDLDQLEWPEKVKRMQAAWIGKSHGAEVIFKSESGLDIPIYTTRPDTLFGATYMVLSPEHPLVPELASNGQKAKVEAYREDSARKSNVERISEIAEKTGVFIGSFAINPVNDKRVPIWISDYVLMDYGTGAIMAVPAHDQRDFEFATKFDLPIVEVIQPPESGEESPPRNPDGSLASAYVSTVCEGEVGRMCSSGHFTGTPCVDGMKEITAWLESRGRAKATVNYRLRDWVFSRQRYWGEPIPIVYCRKCGETPIPEKDLPVLLPHVEHYEPTGTGKSPLAAIPEFTRTTCPVCGGPADRETDTMPQWAGSSWYFLRYPSVDVDSAVFDKKITQQWLPVDMYVGGVEHAVLHLLYARFWTKVLKDAGLIDFDEPFTRLFNQGMICKRSSESGRLEKMSKSKGNVVSPDDLIREYGTDSVRLYELFVGPPDLDSEWDDKGIEGIHRFLRRVWRMVLDNKDSAATPSLLQEKRSHQTIKKVRERLEGFQFNTLVSALMEYVNFVYSEESGPVPKAHLEVFLRLLAPLAPHVCEELWEVLGHTESIFKADWPEYDEGIAAEERVTIVVQVNGKVRDRIEVSVDADPSEVIETARKTEGVAKNIEGKKILKEIHVPNRLVNFVVR
jgi:leucyl-tRNA synthetase